MKLRYIGPLSVEAVKELELLHHDGATHRERERAQAVVLSSRGYTVNQLAGIFHVDRDTVSLWLDRYEKHGIAGLHDAPKSGRPPKVNLGAQDIIRQALEHPRPDLKPHLLERLKKGA